MAVVVLWCLSLSVVSSEVLSLLEQKFAIEPQDQTAIIGTKVTLPCRVVNKSGNLQWTRDDFALGLHRNLSDYIRYQMVGTDDEGDFSLSIDQIALEDNARFQCQVGPGKQGEPGIRSRFAYLTVLVPPEPPEIVQGDRMIVTEDREIELECVSKNGKPAAEIIWIDGLGNVITKNAEYRTEPQPNKLVIARSVLTIKPRQDYHNTTFSCQAQNTAERQYQSAKLLMLVKYAPKVTLKINASENLGDVRWNQIVEGADVQIVCRADANPRDITYRWYLNDTSVFTELPTEYVIRNISRRLHDSIVKCEAYNAVGKSEDSETLQIVYGPRFMRRPKSVQAEADADVTLACEVEGNPMPEISWVHENFERKLVGYTSNLTVHVTNETIGKYYCKAFTAGFPEISSEAYVHLRGKPLIKRQPVQYALPGDRIQLDCNVYSIPIPERLTWSFNGKDISLEDRQDYSMSEETTENGVRCSLIIHNSKLEHFGGYNCTALNKYGSDSIEIMLKPQKSTPLMFLLIGILGAVIIIVTVILIALLCQRKVKKIPPLPPVIMIDSEKLCRDSDRSSNISDVKLEVRNGASASNQNCDDCNTGQDSDSVITRLSLLNSSLGYDSRLDPDFLPKSDGHSNNGYIQYVDYAKDYNPPPLNMMSSSQTASPSFGTSNFHSNTLEMSVKTGFHSNPFARVTNSPTTTKRGQTSVSPYCTLRNGNLPHSGRFSQSPTSQFILANNVNETIIKKGSLATHV